MNSPFTYDEGSLLLRLLIAHILTDFIFQTEKGITTKKEKLLKAPSFWLHGAYTGIVAAVLLWGRLSWPVLALIVLSHLLIDYCKLVVDKKITATQWERKSLWLFITDQVLHLIILVLAWLVLINGFSKMSVLLKAFLPNNRVLLIILGYLTVSGPVTYLIKFLTLRWAADITEENNSLKDAGKWIGILERILIITMVFIEQYTAIGFLVTAKSILRLIDKPDVPEEKRNEKYFSSRKHTEYVLIGTFLSFGLAVLTGLLINWLLKL